MANDRTRMQRGLLLLGSFGPVGHLPASGTMAVALVGLPLYWFAARHMSIGAYLAVAVVFTLASVLLHDAGDRILGEKDSRKLVWDELVGFMFAMTAVPATWQLVVLGFFLERALDIAKVPPANLVERKVPGGWGVVGDDVVAGLYTCALLHGAWYLAPGLFGSAAASAG